MHRPVVACGLTLFNELPADDVDPRVEEEARFHDALDKVPENVPALDVCPFVLHDTVEIVAFENAHEVCGNDDHRCEESRRNRNRNVVGSHHIGPEFGRGFRIAHDPMDAHVTQPEPEEAERDAGSQIRSSHAPLAEAAFAVTDDVAAAVFSTGPGRAENAGAGCHWLAMGRIGEGE